MAAARALAGDLRVADRDPVQEREALERIAAWAAQFTPMVSLEERGILLDVAASLKLFGGHARLCAAVRRGIRELGFQATLGVAPTPLAARLFARAEAQGRAVRSCTSSEELRERLDDLPLFLLDWPERTLARLADLGVLRLRDLLALPSAGIGRRFGLDASVGLDRLMGRLPDPRTPYAPPPRFRSRLELPAEADGVESLLFPLRRLLAELEGALRGRGAGVQTLLLSLEHGHKARTRVPLEFASPEREADFIFGIAREKLGRLVLPAATHALSLHAEALLPYAPRESTWLPGAREQAVDAQRLVERLCARLGRESVFTLALGDDHRPEKGWSRIERAGKEPVSGRERSAGRFPRRPVWLLPRPHRLVTNGGEPMLQGALRLEAGPERIEAGWWDGDEVRRDYFVAANPRGETFWIYREHRDLSAWYLHGVFA